MLYIFGKACEKNDAGVLYIFAPYVCHLVTKNIDDEIQMVNRVEKYIGIFMTKHTKLFSFLYVNSLMFIPFPLLY